MSIEPQIHLKKLIGIDYTHLYQKRRYSSSLVKKNVARLFEDTCWMHFFVTFATLF